MLLLSKIIIAIVPMQTTKENIRSPKNGISEAILLKNDWRLAKNVGCFLKDFILVCYCMGNFALGQIIDEKYISIFESHEQSQLNHIFEGERIVILGMMEILKVK